MLAVLCFISPRAYTALVEEPNWSATWDADDLSLVRSKFNWSGYLKNETAYRYIEPRTYTKIRNTFYLRGTMATTDWLKITAAGRAYHDLAYELFDYNTIAARSEREIDQPLTFVETLAEERDTDVVELRELYADLRLDQMDVRIGKQFVIWGVLTGIRVVDEINPLDFRELIMPELLDYRIPLWSVKVDLYDRAMPNDTFEALWIPDIRFHRPAPAGSEWELLQEVPGTVYPPSFAPKNSELGFRLGHDVGNTEFNLSYFFTWDDYPVEFRNIRVTRSGPNGTVIRVESFFAPRYTRIHMFGLTFRSLIKGQVLKGEAAFVTDKYFGLEAVDRNRDGLIDNQGAVQKQHIRWGVGVDFNLWKTEFSPAFSQWIILGYDPDLIQAKFDTAFNLFVRKEMPENNSLFELLGIYLITLNELYLKPKLTFNITDQFQFAAGFDLFYGQPSRAGVIFLDGRPTALQTVEQRSQFIGNFAKNDRVFFELKYSF